MKCSTVILLAAVSTAAADPTTRPSGHTIAAATETADAPARPQLPQDADSLEKFLVGKRCGEITFLGNGFIRHVIWEGRGLSTSWRAIDRRTVLLQITKGRSDDINAILQFSDDLARCGGIDFEGRPWPAAPVDLIDAAVTPAGATTDPSPMTVNQAETLEDAAARKALSRVHKSKEYIQAEEAVEADKEQTPDAQQRLDPNSKYSKDWLAMKEIARKAVDSDPDLIRARALLAAAVEVEKQNQARAQELKKEQESDAAAAKKAEENSPVRVAIREHRIVLGMTLDQAKEAEGKFIAAELVQDAGSSKTYRWTNYVSKNLPDGGIGSADGGETTAIFVGGVITEVDRQGMSPPG
jgi:hypothetical protein